MFRNLVSSCPHKPRSLRGDSRFDRPAAALAVGLIVAACWDPAVALAQVRAGVAPQATPSATPGAAAEATPAPAGASTSPSPSPSTAPPAEGGIQVIGAVDRNQLEPAVREQLAKAEQRVEEHGEDPAAVGELAVLYHAYGLLPSAARMYDRAIALQPESFRWHYLRGQVAMTLGDAPAAVTHLREARRLKPDYLPAGQWLGRALVLAGDPEEALRVLQPLHDANPENDIVGYTLGLTYREVKEPVWALQYLKPVLERHPEMGAVRSAIVRTFEDLGQPERAEEVRAAWPPNDLSPPLRDPELVAVYRNTVGTEADVRRAVAYMAAGEPARAVEFYSSALAHSPENRDALAGRAEARLQAGDATGGESDLRALLAADPDNLLALTRLGQLHLLRGEADEARKLVEQALKRAPSDPTLLAITARLATMRGDYRAAADALKKAVAQAPGNAELRFELGGALWFTDEREAAVDAFQQAIRIDSDFTPALQALADAYAEMGKASAAETWYQRAYEAGSTDPVTCLRAAGAALARGDYAETETALKRGLAVTPDDVRLNDALARLRALCPWATYRNGEEALQLAHKAHGSDEAAMSPRALFTLAAAYAELNNFAEARRLVQVGLEHAQRENNKIEINRMETYLGLYAKDMHEYDVK